MTILIILVIVIFLIVLGIVSIVKDQKKAYAQNCRKGEKYNDFCERYFVRYI